MHKGQKIVSLEAASDHPLATKNSILFAALTALGIPPESDLCGEFTEDTPSGKRSITVWRLREKSLDGVHDTKDLIAKWKDPDFARKEPDHPLAYIQAAFENHTKAIDFIKGRGPIAMIRRGKKIALISRDTDAGTRKRILNELNK